LISEQWERVKDVLGAVDGLSAAERGRALDELCRGDLEVRREVDSLLAQEDRIELLSEPIDIHPWFGDEPRQAGPYRIERLIGAGGMGAVYLARRSDQVFQKQVAIKVIQCMGGHRLDQRFRTERQILATLEHPSIARLLDGGALDDGRPYLVMEYVEGVRIDEYVDHHKLEVGEILKLFLKVCAGVQYAHQNFVVHRDLKPGNILVTPAGEPRLLDFGIARLLTRTVDTTAEETRPFERLLTPASASPEQLAGGPVTTASDVYSLGLLLYRLLTGVSPYAGARNFRTDPNAVVLYYDPPLASKTSGLSHPRAAGLRGDLDMILAKALEKEVSRRYQTVEELAWEIERYVAGRPIKARANSHLYVARRFIRRNRLAVTAATLLVLSLAGGVAGTLIYARRAEREKELAVKRLDSVRRISESLLFEFHDSIRDLPGATPARALIVRRALEYLDQVASEDSSDPAVQRDVAAAYVRIGNLLSGERGPHLGGPDALNNSIKGYERALAIRRRLVQKHPDDPALRGELLESLWAVSYAYGEQGHLDQAIDLQKDRLRVIQDSPQKGTFSLQYSLGATYSALSEMYRTRGDHTQALAFAQRALQEREAMLKQYPGNARAERALGLSYNMVGYALASQERYAESAQDFEKALLQFNGLAQASSTSSDMQRNLEVAEMDLCEMLARSRSAAQAMPHCHRALAMAQAMLSADPQNVQTREDVGAAFATLGFTAHQLGERKAALAWDRQAETQYATALAQDVDATEATAGYADTLAELAKVESELHRASAACGHLSKARAILNRLAANAPSDATVQERLKSLPTIACQ
jgi:eukaryotic-like serine/threonine-protein kinase